MTIITSETILCPHCKGRMRTLVGISGNTIGSTLWSDGFLDAPMLQPNAWAITCPHCGEAFFREETTYADEYAPLAGENSNTLFPVQDPFLDGGELATYQQLLDKTESPQDCWRPHFPGG